MSEKLNPSRVAETFRHCLFTDDEVKDLEPGDLPAGLVEAEGVATRIGFHGERLAGMRETIKEMLSELPKEFMPSRSGGGGGWSFLMACQDANGELWTGVHRTVDELLMLGIASGFVKFLLPRELWSSLPGGTPYLAIDLEPMPDGIEDADSAV